MIGEPTDEVLVRVPRFEFVPSEVDALGQTIIAAAQRHYEAGTRALDLTLLITEDN